MLTQASDNWTIGEAAHLLNRAGFGGDPAEYRKLHGLGRSKAVEHLLAMKEPVDRIPAPAWTENQEEIVERARKRFAEARSGMQGLSDEERDRKRRRLNQERQREQRAMGRELQEWWFRRMVMTGAPLREKMTLFWHDHFATSVQKVRDPRFIYAQNMLFRQYAAGDFKELTHKVARDPAMMLYLDTPTSKRGKPNENFARELLELFTLGEGHYTEQDIKEAARAFTGYTLNRLTGAVVHNRQGWDPGEKQVLGKTGKFDGDGVVDVIFEQEQAARYVPSKLWEFFAYEEPPEDLVVALGDAFTRARFRVKPLLRTIFLSKEFYSERAVRTQIKSPVQFLAQMLRQLEVDEVPHRYVAMASEQLGQVLYNPPNVAGWDWGKAWINTNSLLTRYNTAGFITQGASLDMANPSDRAMMGGAGRMAASQWKGPDYKKIAPKELRKDTGQLVRALVFRFFQDDLEPKQRQAFEDYAKAKRGVVFTDREIAELVHLMMSTPYYQLT